MPANPAPVTNNTREDDKPLPKTTREAVAVKKKTKQEAAAQKEGKGSAKVKAKQKQDKEAANATAPLGQRTDDVKPTGKGRGGQGKAKPEPTPVPEAAKPKPKPKPNKPTAMSQPKRPEVRPKRESTKREDMEDEPQIAQTNKKQRRAPKPGQDNKIVEVALPKTKTRKTKNLPPSEQEEAARDVLRASKRRTRQTPASKTVENFTLGSDPTEKRKLDAPIPRMPKNLRVR